MLTRVWPGKRTQASRIPLLANSRSKMPALSLPSSPVTVTARPRSARQAATFTALPPACISSQLTRLSVPAAKPAMPMLWSMAGLRLTAVTVRGAIMAGPGVSPDRCR